MFLERAVGDADYSQNSELAETASHPCSPSDERNNGESKRANLPSFYNEFVFEDISFLALIYYKKLFDDMVIPYIIYPHHRSSTEKNKEK